VRFQIALGIATFPFEREAVWRDRDGRSVAKGPQRLAARGAAQLLPQLFHRQDSAFPLGAAPTVRDLPSRYCCMTRKRLSLCPRAANSGAAEVVACYISV
jgi:hypothetical protein